MSFWYSPPSFLTKLLTPFSMLYPLIGKLCELVVTSYKSSIPVVCVGNVVVGGSGKTPTVIALAKMYKMAGRNVHILSRGYGGSLQGPVLVDQKKHDYKQVGDEPLLLSEEAPTWVCKNRVTGIKAIEAHGDVDLILLDDGLQNPSVVKDVVYLVLNASQGIGNGLCLPFGPLREPLSWALSKSHNVLILGKGDFKLEGATYADIQVENGDEFKGKDVIAFAGLGFPQKFFASLRGAGANVIQEIAFPDHHPYVESDFTQMLNSGLILVTTAKDYVRLPKNIRDNVKVLHISLKM